MGGFGLEFLGVSFPLLAPNGTSAAPSYSFSAQSTLGLYSPATGQIGVTGNLLAGRVVFPRTTSYIVLETEKRTLYTNTGSSGGISFSLPNNPTVGDEYQFYVDAAFSLTVQAQGSDVIRVSGALSAAGGNAASSTVGSSLTLVCIKANTWIATSVVGTWTVT